MALIFVLSCSKMEDNFKNYLETEETIYAAKVDSVSVKPGYNRVKFDISIGVGNIETIRIFWNNYTDSTEVNINNQTGVFSKILANLPEKDYAFNFISLDAHGNKSLPFDVYGKVYGDKYMAVRAIRPIKEVVIIDVEHIIIVWNGIVDDGVSCRLNYTDVNGEEVILNVPMSEMETEITEINVKKGFSYTTLYEPEPNVIDEFISDPFTIVPTIALELNKDTWSLVKLPTDTPGDCYGGNITNLWNNKTNDYYHSGCHGENNDGIPHHFTIDLGVDVSLVRIQLDPRKDCCQGRNPKKFQIWGIPDITDASTTLESNDPGWENEMIEKGWIKLIDHETSPDWNGSADGYRTDIPSNSSVRYIRYRILETWNGEPYGALSEITLWNE